MKDAEYWQARVIELNKALSRLDNRFYAEEVERAFRLAQGSIIDKINAWYQRLAGNNDISIVDAKKMLTRKELQEFRWTVEEYIKHGEENAITQQWNKELENASARVHISRLEALLIEMQNDIETLYGNYNDALDKHLKDTYSESYKRTAYEIDKGFGVDMQLNIPDTDQLKDIISKPWVEDGKTFSDRIWRDKGALADTLKREMPQMIIRGESAADVTRRIADRMNVSKSNAARLVATESAFFGTKAQFDCYANLGVKEYEFCATLDYKTSDMCREHDGKHYKMKDYKQGVNAPPLHCWCRSCIVPYFDDEDTLTETRAARDYVTGKTIQVPSKMTYKEWEKEYGNLKFGEEVKIKKNDKNNDYTVNRQIINSKEYHDKFESLDLPKPTREALYLCSKKILKERDGTGIESAVALSERDGTFIAQSSVSKEGKTGFTIEEMQKIKDYGGNVILLHNHPNSGRLSSDDFFTAYDIDNTSWVIAAGHNGKLACANNFNRKIDIEARWNKWYNEVKEVLKDKGLAKLRATDRLYKLGAFDYEER